jgi:hypothetical protein
VVSCNGNNIRAIGALSSRVLGNRLMTDDSYPQNRPVTHTDPIGWTAINRPRILKGLYTILIYGCRNRPSGQVPLTRFDNWWLLVEWPTEAAAALCEPALHFCFVDCFKATEAQDSRRVSITETLRFLRSTFGSIDRDTKAVQAGTAQVNPGTTGADAVKFGSVHIRNILDAGERGREDPSKTGAQAQIDLANEFLDLFEALKDRRRHSPTKIMISKALEPITDRPEELDATTVGILRYTSTHNIGRFYVEIHTLPTAANNIVVTNFLHPGVTQNGSPDTAPDGPDAAPDGRVTHNGPPPGTQKSQHKKVFDVGGQKKPPTPAPNQRTPEPGQHLPAVEEPDHIEQQAASAGTISPVIVPAEHSRSTPLGYPEVTQSGPPAAAARQTRTRSTKRSKANGGTQPPGPEERW